MRSQIDSNSSPQAEVPVPSGLVEALARAVVAVLSPPPHPPSDTVGDAADFLTAAEFARRLGVSRETVRRLAIADVLPHTVVCRGATQTTRRFPRRFADDFAASGTDTADLAGFAERWRARVAGAAR
jgi:excisionase family DNA binding protein